MSAGPLTRPCARVLSVSVLDICPRAPCTPQAAASVVNLPLVFHLKWKKEDFVFGDHSLPR